MTRAETTTLASELRSAPPDTPALITSAGSVRYGELPARLGGLAARLREARVEPGQPIAVVSGTRCRQAIAMWLGAWAGNPVLPLDAGRPDIEQLLFQANINTVFADAGMEFEAVTTHPSEWPAAVEDCPTTSPDPAAGEHAWLVTTSGTLGAPRIVKLGQRALLAHARASNSVTGLAAGDRWLTPLPLQHIGGLAVLVRCLAAGATTSVHERFSPKQILAELKADPVTHLSLVPPMLSKLLDVANDTAPPESLRCVLVGGGSLNPTLADRARAAGWPLWVSYGMTETCSHVALDPVDPGWTPGRAGTPLPGIDISIVGEKGQAADAAGRIGIAGDVVMDGYLGTASRDPANSFLTGDLGYLDQQGRLVVIGRADDVLISGGTNIHPAAVEQVIEDCPGVDEAGVTSLPDSQWGDRLIALYTGSADAAQLDAWCRSRLDSAARPRQFTRVDTLPRSGPGKLNRKTLVRLAQELG